MLIEYRYDIKGFSDELGLPIESIATLYIEFIKEMELQIFKSKALLASKDYDSFKTIIHNIKGLSANFRITDVYEESAKIHKVLKSGNYDTIDTLFLNFFTVCENATKKIIESFKQINIIL